MLFGTSAIAAGRWSPNLGGMSLAGWRLVIGGATLVMLSAGTGRAPWRYPLPVRSVIIGGVTVAGFQVGYFAAVDRLGVTQATTLTIATGPAVAAVMDHVRGRAAISVRWCAGSLMAVTGIAVMSTGTWVMDPLGWGLAILAGFGFPIYGSIIGSLARDRPRLTAVATVFGAAVPLAAVMALATDGFDLPAGDDIITVAYLGLIATAAAYYMWAVGLETLPVRDTVVITMLEPITATLLAAVILQEHLPLVAVFAVATIIIGIAVAATGSSQRADHLRQAWSPEPGPAPCSTSNTRPSVAISASCPPPLGPESNCAQEARPLPRALRHCSGGVRMRRPGRPGSGRDESVRE